SGCPNQHSSTPGRTSRRWHSLPSPVGTRSPSRIRCPRRGFHFRVYRAPERRAKTMSNFKFIETSGAPITAWVNAVPREPSAAAQLRNMAGLPFIYKHVAVMPDVHLGKGATVGSVIPTKGAIVPAAVGVDIGCGMCAAMTDLVANDLPDSLAPVRKAIEKAVPVGQGSHKEVPKAADKAWYGK